MTDEAQSLLLPSSKSTQRLITEGDVSYGHVRMGAALTKNPTAFSSSSFWLKLVWFQSLVCTIALLALYVKISSSFTNSHPEGNGSSSSIWNRNWDQDLVGSSKYPSSNHNTLRRTALELDPLHVKENKDMINSSTSSHVLIVYQNSTVEMTIMAQAIAEGVKLIPSATARMRTVEQVNYASDVVEWSDAVILGSPVINANIHPQLLEWIMTQWNLEQLNPSGDRLDTQSRPRPPKVGAAFVVAGGVSAGQEMVLLQLVQALMIFQFAIVGGHDWTAAFGASAIVGEGPFLSSTRDPATIVCPLFREKAKGLGKRVAEISRQLAKQ